MAHGMPSNLQIKVTLDGLRPPIWRRLVISGDATLFHLHLVLQVAMGWENSHLHCFRVEGRRYGPQDGGFSDTDDVDEAGVSVAEVFTNAQRGNYDYDFGHGRDHRLLVEARDVPLALSGVATCTGGRRACPPEDCGGIWGYANLLDALADPKHPEREETLEWLGDDFDPEAFDPETVNARLKVTPAKRSRR
jgi:Plasmid pRiA4b ORF-3-like protein